MDGGGCVAPASYEFVGIRFARKPKTPADASAPGPCKVAQDFTVADSSAKLRFALSCRAPWPCAEGPRRLACSAVAPCDLLGPAALPGAARPLQPVVAGRNAIGSWRRADECVRGRNYDVCPNGSRPWLRAAIDQDGPRVGAALGWRSGDGGVCVASQSSLSPEKRHCVFLARPAELRRPVSRGAATRSLSPTWALEPSRSTGAIDRYRPKRMGARGACCRVQLRVALQISVFPGFEAAGNLREAIRRAERSQVPVPAGKQGLDCPCPRRSALAPMARLGLGGGGGFVRGAAHVHRASAAQSAEWHSRPRAGWNALGRAGPADLCRRAAARRDAVETLARPALVEANAQAR